MIAEILKETGAIGAARGVSVYALMLRTQCNSPRQVIAAVKKEREAGAIICSDNVHGYYLPATADEVRAFIAIQEKRIVSHAKTIKAARRHIKELEHKAE